jgi:hypothetical protein
MNDINEKVTQCKAIKKMNSDQFYVPQWDEVREKVFFVESRHPKCVRMENNIYDYKIYELPEDAEMIILGYFQIW